MPLLEEETTIPLLALIYGFSLNAGTVHEAYQRSKSFLFHYRPTGEPVRLDFLTGDYCQFGQPNRPMLTSGLLLILYRN